MKSKIRLWICLSLIFILSFSQVIYATEVPTITTTENKHTVMMVPLDSRPISIEYVENLTRLAGDDFIASNKSYLDFFSDQSTMYNHFGNSALVRQELAMNLMKNQGKDTTVIINGASYFTGGLVGSRSYSNYMQLQEGLNELQNLVTTYTEPYYYVNVVMPRTLPDERNNTIWPNKTKLKGLGNFYIKYNTNNKSAVESRFKQVSPAQFLLEWSYVQSKADELGNHALTAWEKEFLNYFNTYYLNNPTYSSYIKAYRGIFEEATHQIKTVMGMQAAGAIDEVVVAIDDFQLPDFIQYCSKLQNEDTSWIQKEGSHIIKFSFSRSYLQVGEKSVYNYHKNLVGNDAFNQSLACNSGSINYLHGVDEIPQLLYARDLVRRKNLTTNFTAYEMGYGLNTNQVLGYVGFYDSATTNELLTATKRFVTRAYDYSINKTEKPFKMFVSQHVQGQTSETEASVQRLIQELFASYNQNQNVGLIEIFSFDVMNEANNMLFKKLSNRNYLQSIGLENHSIAQLGAYCSWNTGANAIGLGMAQAQVFGIAEALSTDAKTTAIHAAKVLAQHVLEDGIYSVQLKAGFNAQAYGLGNYESRNYNEVLRNKLNNSGVLSNFIGTPIRINEEEVWLTHATITGSSFPWLRRFECYVDVDFAA